MIRRSTFLLALALTVRASAQDAPTQQLPEGHAPVDDTALRRALGQGGPRVAEVSPSPDVPAGAIDVLVVDDGGAPLASVDVRLGILARGQSGGERHLRTDAQGLGRFAAIPPDVAARVTVDYQGARYLTPPIQMQPDMGQRVLIRRLSTTRDPRTLLQRIGRTIVEWKTDRVRITQLVELLNYGASTFVFASPGLSYPLPEGALAFEAERQMNHLQVTKTAAGFRITGSVPPGTAQLSWHYDLPLHGEEFEFSQGMPFPQTVQYQVVVDAAEGMELDVRGFPDSQPIDYQGRSLLVTEIERTPQSPPLSELAFTVRGIPGPGPFRWIAIALACLGLGWSAYRLQRTYVDAAQKTVGRDERERARAALLDEAEDLAKRRAAGDVGDSYFERERDRIVEELALLEHADATAPA